MSTVGWNSRSNHFTILPTVFILYYSVWARYISLPPKRNKILETPRLGQNLSHAKPCQDDLLLAARATTEDAIWTSETVSRARSPGK